MPDPEINTAESTDADAKKVEGLTAALKSERTKRQGLEQTVAGLQGQVEGLYAASASASKPDNTPTSKNLSVADLRAAVIAGEITEDQSQEIRDRQSERRLDSRVDERVTATVNQNAQNQRVGVEIGRYMTAVPDLNDRSTAAFTKLQTEYDWLTSHGHTKGPTTELVAARAAFGPIADVEAAAAPGKRETHQETGGHGDDAGGSGKGDGPSKGMSADQRNYYQDLINKGVVADWASANAKLQYKPKHAPRQRRAA